MVIDWLKFIPALALLLTPATLFHGPQVRYRGIGRDWDRHWRQILSLGSHTIDLGRAALGSWLLLESVSASPVAGGIARQLPLLLTGSIRMLAVLIQTVTCREPDRANAPFTFVAGLLFGGASPLAALFSSVLSLALTTGARAPVAFFPLLAAAHLAMAYLFGGPGLAVRAIAGAAAVSVPWVWSLLFRRQLVIAYLPRRAESAATH